MTLPESQRLHGLVTAVHTPFHADGSLNLPVVEAQAAHLLRHGVAAVFVCGSTGESASLTVEERRAVAARWRDVLRGSPMRLVVHVGANCLEDARVLAGHAEELGAVAISALSPSYFKPRTVGMLVEICAHVASAAPATPFYFYDIPLMTGVSLPMAEFVEVAAERIPTFSGLKFTNPDLMTYQFLLRAGGGLWDVPYGLDEQMLAALVLGAKGAVGSGFNFAAPIYRRLMSAFASGNLEAARCEQFRGAQLVQILAGHGYMGAARAVMGMLGVPVGPARLPHPNPAADQLRALQTQLEALGFFEWVA